MIKNGVIIILVPFFLVCREPLDFVNLDSARQSTIEALRSERRSPSPRGKGEEEDRVDEATASPNSQNLTARGIASQLETYKAFLDWGTYQGQDWSSLPRLPQSRYETFRFVFDHFERNGGKVLVELGTSRSFNHGGLVGCNSDLIAYWKPDQPETWDWGAGFFTRMAAVCLSHLSPQIHTVDLIPSHIARCQVMTAEFSQIISYHISDSVAFLKECDFPQGIDLLYLDTGDMTPIEPTALLQLEEVKVIVERDLLAKEGLILIDDVKNRTPREFGEKSDLGKSKYSLPFLLQHGFEIVMDEYQVVLRKQ